MCQLVDGGLSIVGYTSDAKGKKMIPLEMNVNDLRTALHLDELSEYDDSPTDDELVEF